jgi:hypothetical protein
MVLVVFLASSTKNTLYMFCEHNHLSIQAPNDKAKVKFVQTFSMATQSNRSFNMILTEHHLILVSKFWTVQQYDYCKTCSRIVYYLSFYN